MLYDDQRGYSLIEMVLAMAIGAIILVGAYASYTVINKQYMLMSSISSVSQAGVPTLQLITRDLRMAGRRAVDSDIQSTYDRIDTPVAITDSGDACCDQLQVVYDKALDERYRVTYFVQPRTTGVTTRNALYMDIDQWDSVAWNNVTDDALVADYIEDFQLEGSDTINGFPSLVDVLLIFRSKDTILEVRDYQKADYEIGNYDLETTDTFFREEFSSTVNLRNLRE